MKRSQVLDTRSTVEGLCGLASGLGYKDKFRQLMNHDGSCVGDLLEFFEDNPGAIEAVVDWVAENRGDVIDDSDEDEEDEF